MSHSAFYSSAAVLTLASLLVAVAAKAAQTEAARPAPAPDVKAMADSNNRFAFDLYGKLKKGEENLFYSPYSISTALAMTYAGARGTTAEEMAKALRLDLPADRLHPACAEMIRDLNEAGKKGDFQLSVANRLWGQKGEPFLKDFLDLTQRNYGAGLSELDFAGNVEAARKTINEWVEKQTAEKIKELIKQGVLKPATRLVLTNAIYMKAEWLAKFKKQDTAPAPFFTADGKEIQAPTMHRTSVFGYAEADDLQTLELVYKGDRLSMVILLPRQKGGLADLEKGLTLESLNKRLAQLKTQKVSVALPKFRATKEFSLGQVLESLGMAKAFDGSQADFSGMNGKRDLFISAVVHKAFVNVDEEGTEAAAATAVVMEATAMLGPERIPEFVADHPFVFLIRDRVTGAILFLGRVTEPKVE